jgi:hypothetical protein
MRPALPLIQRLLSKFTFDVFPAACATVFGAFLLSHLNLGAPRVAAVAPVSAEQNLTAAEIAQLVKEDHALMAHFLKSYPSLEQGRAETSSHRTAMSSEARNEPPAKNVVAREMVAKTEPNLEATKTAPRARATAAPIASTQINPTQANPVQSAAAQPAVAQNTTPPAARTRTAQAEPMTITPAPVVASALPAEQNVAAVAAQDPQRLEPPLPVAAEEWTDRSPSVTTRIVGAVTSPVRWVTGAVESIADGLVGSHATRSEFHGGF